MMHEKKSEDSEAKMRQNENSRGKGGSRLKLRNVDGDVPLSEQSYCEDDKDSSSKKEIEDSSKKRQQKQNGMR